MKKESMIRFAAVGTSKIMDLMQEAMHLTQGVECRVIVSRDLERGKAYAAKAGVPEASDDYEAVCRREDIDAVYIASPNACHVEQALTALRSGKHVVVEKPTAVTEAEVLLLKETAKANNVYFFEAITTLFMPNYLALKEKFPRLGKILSVEMCYGQYSSKMEEYKSGKIPSSFSTKMAGGALNDMGIYCIHPALDLFGVPDEISYHAVEGTDGIDLEGVLQVRWGDLKGVLRASKVRNVSSGLRILGENGYLVEDGPMNDFATCAALLDGTLSFVELQHGENRMLYELAAFRDAILAQDDAFFEKMAAQSAAASRILEIAHATASVRP